MITKVSLKDSFIKQIVSRLRKFGFVNVNKENIAIDEVYRFYFLKILNEKKGENKDLDIVINQLLTSMNLKNETTR